MTGSDTSTTSVPLRAVRVLQLVVAIAALGWLLVSLEVDRAVSLLVVLDASILAFVGGLTVVEFGTRYLMWYALLRERTRATFRTVFRIDLVIKFVNHIVPSKAAGHSVAPLVVRYYTPLSWTESITLAAANTAIYATLYAIVAGVSIVLLAPFLSWGLLSVLVFASGIYLAVGLAILLAGRNLGRVRDSIGRVVAGVERIFPVVGRVVGTVPPAPLTVADSSTRFANTTGRPRVVVPYVVGWLGTVVVLPGLRAGSLLWALGALPTPWWLVPFALLLGYSVTVVPITPGGIGVAEVSAALVLVALGVPEPTAALVVLLDRSLGVYLPAVLGWFPAARIDLARLLAERTG